MIKSLFGSLAALAVGLGLLVPLSPVTAQDELTCEERYEQAAQLLTLRRVALQEGKVFVVLDLIREANDLFASCVDSQNTTDLFAAGADNQWEPVVQLFENISMVQVPSGCFMMGNDAGKPDQAPAHEQCFYGPYWIDQTEVTRAMYAMCVADSACTPTAASAVSTEDNQPINQAKWDQAQSYCAWRGMRLPTEAEWEYAARGPAGLIFPWGNDFVADNLVFGTNSGGKTAQVGSRPAGASWVGALDMSGNIAEWTLTVYQSYPYDNTASQISRAYEPHVVRGGDYHLDLSINLSTTARTSYEPFFELDNVGFRCVSGSSEPLTSSEQVNDCPARFQQAAQWFAIEQDALEADNISYVQFIMAGARNLLMPCVSNTSWVPRVQNFNQVEMVSVPPGCFQMGRDDGDITERPAHEVCIENPYWLDKTEVTRAMYTACVAAGVCEEIPSSRASSRDTQPVNGVTWFQANTYCTWREARLPTEAEWEYAARGPESWLYPWGNMFIEDNLVYATLREMADVGSVPAGASWVGALDMSGNAMEWVSSLYQDYPYNRAEVENSSDTTERRVTRGGAYSTYDPLSVASIYRSRVLPDYGLDTNGFRCARDG